MFEGSKLDGMGQELLRDHASNLRRKNIVPKSQPHKECIFNDSINKVYLCRDALKMQMETFILEHG
jgi:hypothetical protein